MDKQIEYDSVTYTYHEGADSAFDIDVEPEAETVIIMFNLDMRGSKKSFPNVKNLIIADSVSDIDMPNTLFPNVKDVKSNSKVFASGKYLMTYSYGSKELKNVFCPDESDYIDLEDIYHIREYAFAGCECINVNGYNRSTITCAKNAFADSGFLKQPFVNGVKMAGAIIAAIDYDADEVILPDDNNQICGLSRDIDFAKAKKVVVHNPRSLMRLSSSCNDSGIPRNVELRTDLSCSPLDIKILAHLRKAGAKTDDRCIENFIITSPYFKNVDGIIYTSDMQRLVACMPLKKKVIVPEGVRVIYGRAFEECAVESVQLPDSLEDVGDYTFIDCKALRKVKLGNGILHIPNGMFNGCINLETFELPKQIRSIGQNAFSYTQFNTVKLDENIRKIEYCAFSNTQLKDVQILGQITELHDSFGNKLEHVTALKYSDSFLSAFTSCWEPRDKDNYGYMLKLDCEGKTVYLPKYVRPGMQRELKKTLSSFFGNFCSEHVELWNYAYSATGREDVAIVEYKAYGAEEARQYLKKNSKRIALRLMEEGDEEKVSEFLKLGLISKITLKNLLSTAKDKNMMSVKAYILEQINKGRKTKQSRAKFYI